MLLKIHERKVNNIYNKLNVNRSYREKKIILTKKVEPIVKEKVIITPVKKVEAIITTVAKPRANQVIVKSTNHNLLTEHELIITKVFLNNIITSLETEKNTIIARLLLNELIYKLKS
jgi:hypothetical protein